MSFYYTNDPNLKENRKSITFRFLGQMEVFTSDDGVFSKSTLDYGSRSLLEYLVQANIIGKVLDLGCGIGYIGILLKKYVADIDLTMSDVNTRAIELAKENSIKYKQDNKVIESTGFDNIEDNFDVIVSNPPIRTGKKIIYDLFKQAYNHLNNCGKLYLVIRKDQGAQSAMDYLRETLGNAVLLRKDKGYWIILVNKIDK